MGPRETFSFRKQLGSFGFAFQGIAAMLRTQHNAWMHLATTMAEIVVGLLLRRPRLDCALPVFATTAVWREKGLNTAIESLADAISTEHLPLLGRADDVTTGVVPLSSIAAVLIGILVFGPPLLELAGVSKP